MREGMTVKRMADLFRARPEALPSDLVPEDEARAMAVRVVARENGVEQFGVRVHWTGEYPAKLREARHPRGALEDIRRHEHVRLLGIVVGLAARI